MTQYSYYQTTPNDVLVSQPVTAPTMAQQSQLSQTTVVVNQPVMMNIGGQPQNIRYWSTGLCGCFEDCSSCLLVTFFPCFYPCCVACDLDENPCGAFCYPTVFATAMRTKIRTLLGIRGSICEDLCCNLWCTCCSLTQTHREWKNSKGYLV